MKQLFAIVAIVLIIVSACGPSQPQLAVRKIELAETLLASGDTITCLLHLDSIPYLYPKAISEARTAIQISNRINVSKLMQQRENFAAANAVIDSLFTQFNPEKGEYDKNTYYTYNGPGSDKAGARTTLHVYLNETGVLFLTSSYYGGQWLNHTSVSVECEATAAKTDSVSADQMNNHRSEFGGSKWEKVTYRSPQADQVIALVAKNYNKKMKVRFTGKSSHTIWLEDRDKNAIKAAYDLSRALKVKDDSGKAIAVLEKKIKSEEE